jgi:hypothetical protein
MIFKSDKQRKAAFANMNGNSKYNKKLNDIQQINVNSQEYEDYLKDSTKDEFISLDPRFNNIKGVAPKDIDDFIYSEFDKINNNKNIDEINHSNKEKIKGLKEVSGSMLNETNEIEDILNFYKIEENKKLTENEAIDKITGQYNLSIPMKMNIRSLLYDDKGSFNNKLNVLKNKRNEMLKNIEINEERIKSLESKNLEPEDNPAYRYEYLKHCRVFDRDDIHDESLELFDKIKDTLEADYNNFKYSNTIFVTSPRGGHELLSIFGYANNIPKFCFPSLTEPEFEFDEETLDNEKIEKGRLSFKTYLDNTNYMNNSSFNVVYIDDVTQSGEQLGLLNETLNNLKRTYDLPEFNVVTATIGSRDFDLNTASPQDNKPEYNYLGHVTNYKLMSKNDYDYKYSEEILDEDDVSGIAFPWSIPDSKNDKLLRELYGGRWQIKRKENTKNDAEFI